MTGGGDRWLSVVADDGSGRHTGWPQIGDIDQDRKTAKTWMRRTGVREAVMTVEDQGSREELYREQLKEYRQWNG